MVDSCRIRRRGEPVFDDATGKYATSYMTVYEGRCRFRPPEVQPQDVRVGEAAWTVQVAVVSLPIDASAGVRDEDVITALSSAFDPHIIDRVLVAKNDPVRSYATARRLTCWEVTPDAE